MRKIDENTRGNIESNARHAQAEIDGILSYVEADDPDAVWEALRAAQTRLAGIADLLDAAEHRPPWKRELA